MIKKNNNNYEFDFRRITINPYAGFWNIVPTRTKYFNTKCEMRGSKK